MQVKILTRTMKVKSEHHKSDRMWAELAAAVGFLTHALLGDGGFSELFADRKNRRMVIRKGQVRFITRPKSRTMRAKRNKRSRANRTNVPK